MIANNHMIDLSYELTIPANTLANDPITYDVAIGEGILKRLIISFKKGCRCYAYVALFYGGTQLLPIVNGQGYAFDNFNLFLYPDLDLTEKHHVMTIKGWSDGSLYPHTIKFLFSMDNKPTSDIASMLSSLFGGYRA